MPCILCGVHPPIANSHVIPHFVYKRLKAGNPIGTLRHSQNFNRAVQDGWKGDYLCQHCDNVVVSSWENYFAATIYNRWLDTKASRFPYNERLSLFLASLHFRNLHHQFRNHPGAAPPQAIALADRLRSMCLNSDAVGKDVFQYIELIKPQTDPQVWPAGVNSYLRETVDMYVNDPPIGRAACVSYVLLPQCICMTTDFDIRPQVPNPAAVDTVEVQPVGELDANSQLGLLLSCNRPHILDRSQSIQDNLSAMSPKQRARLQASIDRHPGRKHLRAHKTWELDMALLRARQGEDPNHS
jgi:hypothetical protein